MPCLLHHERVVLHRELHLTALGSFAADERAEIECESWGSAAATIADWLPMVSARPVQSRSRDPPKRWSLLDYDRGGSSWCGANPLARQWRLSSSWFW